MEVAVREKNLGMEDEAQNLRGRGVNKYQDVQVCDTES